MATILAEISNQNPADHFFCLRCMVKGGLGKIQLIELFNPDSDYLLHFTCKHCGAMMIIRGFVGKKRFLKTLHVLQVELDFDETLKFVGCPRISLDDVMDIHSLLESGYAGI